MHLDRYQLTLLIMTLAVVPACEEDKDEGDTTGDDAPGGETGDADTDTGEATTGAATDSGAEEPPDEEPYWVVGDDGVMLRVDAHGDAAPYPVELSGDLLDIACQGRSRAWVVGTGGGVLRTTDGGLEWQVVTSPIDSTLRAVAVSAGDVVYAAGDDGAVLRSVDAGASWNRVAAPLHDFTDVATKGAGDTAWLGAADGTLWIHEGGSATQTFAAPAAVYGIAVATDAPVAVAVGADGLIARSDDDGLTWDTVDATTSVDLLGVVATSDGEATAVGEDGTVVYLVGQTVQTLTVGAADLHAVHLTADGHGNIVGELGAIFATGDHGESWFPIESGVSQTLRGVDALGHAHR